MKYSFEKINDEVYAKLAGDSTYVINGKSYLKIFQHGLIYALSDTRVKLLRTYFTLPLFLQKLILQKSSRKSRIKGEFEKVLIFDVGRPHSSQAPEKSFFFEKILRLSQQKATTVNLNPQHGVKSDYNFEDLINTSSCFDHHVMNQLKEVNELASRLRKSSYYSTKEKEYIKSALHVFFHSFLKFYSVLKDSGVEKIIYTVHYHNEGIVAAAEKLGIEIIEMQHGLISANDLYYCYPESLKSKLINAFFPSKILLFGQYWKGVLSKGAEWKTDQLQIIGSVLPTQNSVPEGFSKQNLILLASQKTMAFQYIPRIEKLLRHLEAHPDWKVLLKLHPLEKELAKYEALKHPQLELLPLVSNLNEYLEKCKIQISIYSTTLYDAAGYEVVNFCWQGDGLGFDYAENIIKEGVAESLHEDEDPILKYQTLTSANYKFLARQDFYAPFSPYF